MRGTGFLHDGSTDTLSTFLSEGVFSLLPSQNANLQQFLFQFPSDLAPIVGQQVTLTSTNASVANPRIDLLIQRADTPFTSFVLGGAVRECDLIVKGNFGSVPHGWVMLRGTPALCEQTHTCLFRGDSHPLNDNAHLWTDEQIRSLAPTEGPLTYTCAPPGSGRAHGHRSKSRRNPGSAARTGHLALPNGWNRAARSARATTIGVRSSNYLIPLPVRSAFGL